MLGAGLFNSEHLKEDGIRGLYYICRLSSLNSILNLGILSHQRKRRRVEEAGQNLSNADIQDRRSKKYIPRADAQAREAQHKPTTINMHRFVNFYMNPHNAMMINIIDGQRVDPKTLCVLCVSREILTRKNVVITDQNAATDAAHFSTPRAFKLDPTQTSALTRKRKGYIRDDAEFKQYKQTRQAEVLVPYEVSSKYITDIIVCDKSVETDLEPFLSGKGIEIIVNPSVFFIGKDCRPGSRGYSILKGWAVAARELGSRPPSPCTSEGSAVEEAQSSGQIVELITEDYEPESKQDQATTP